MARWPFPNASTGLANYAVTTSMPTTTGVTAGAAHTKGSYVQLESSTSEEWFGFYVYVANTSTATTNTSTLMDVAVGGAGSEQVIVSNFPIGYAGVYRGYWFPLYVGAGQRVAIRTQSAVASKVIQMATTGIRRLTYGVPMVYAKSSTYGASTGTSRGVTLTASATANTMGSYTELSAAIGDQIDALSLNPMGNGSTAITAISFNLEVASGAGGSEQTSLQGHHFIGNTSEYWDLARAINQNPFTRTDILPIPAGARIAARVSATTGSSTCDLAVTGYTR